MNVNELELTWTSRGLSLELSREVVKRLRWRKTSLQSHHALARAVKEAKLPHLVLLLRLLPSQCHLSRHHPLSLGYQRALGTYAVLPATVPFVSLQC